MLVNSKASGIILSNFGKIRFFPLKNSKYFNQFCSDEGGPPTKNRKNVLFFFLTLYPSLSKTYRSFQFYDHVYDIDYGENKG